MMFRQFFVSLLQHQTTSTLNNTHQWRFFSKFISKSAKKRLTLTTKRARKGFYKGKGGTKEGRHNSKGRYIIDPRKRVELIIPDLEGFKLKPYIHASVPKIPPEKRASNTPMTR